MSYVTNVIIAASCEGYDTDLGIHDPAIDSVNEFLRKAEDRDLGDAFVEVHKHAGGNKVMECNVYMAAFKNITLALVLKAVDQAPWEYKDDVQVFVREDADDRFHLRYSGGKFYNLYGLDTLTAEDADTRQKLGYP
jgi:hypothetical protein